MTTPERKRGSEHAGGSDGEPVFATSTVIVGRFRKRPVEPDFATAGPITSHQIVFPRTAVEILYDGRSSVVADPNRVMLYNAHQPYRRRAVCERGDACEWYAYAPEAVLETVAAHDPSVRDAPETPFRNTNAPCDASWYLAQRRVFERVARGDSTDPLEVEETLLDLLRNVVAALYVGPGRGPAARPQTRRARSEQVEAARAALASGFDRRPTLAEVARAAHVSPCHLCRIFRDETGTTICAHLTQLRLRAALERLCEPGIDLTRLGLDVGFSSHSHFTSSFRRVFGATPSQVRREASPQRLRQMSNSVTV